MKKLLITCILIASFFNVLSQSFYPPVGDALSIAPGMYNLAHSSNSAGAVWSTTKVNFQKGWILTFEAQFDILQSAGADGICVVFGDNLRDTSLNYNGGCIGYYHLDSNNINPDFLQSFAVEVDIYENNPYANDPGDNYDHIMLALNGDFYNVPTGGVSVHAISGKRSIKDTTYHNYRICWDYDNFTLSVYVDNILRISSTYSYHSFFTQPASVKWGFTSATGGSRSNHFIRNIQMAESNGCIAINIPDTLNIMAKPLNCNTREFTAKSTDANIIAYDWDFDDGNTASGNPVQHTYASFGTYTVKLVTTNDLGKKDSTTMQITIAGLKGLYIIGDQDVCKGSSVNLFARGAQRYLWYPEYGLDNPISSNPIASPDSTTMYIVEAEDLIGCKATDSLIVRVRPVPDVGVIAEDIVLGCDKLQMQLYAAVKPDDSVVSYSWFPEKYFDDPTKNNVVVSPDITTAVWLKVTNNYGCLNQDSVLVRVNNDGFVVLPDAFTPNGDGLNETIYPYINCKIEMKEFNVYHRNGQRVFHTKTPLDGWDGTFKGQPLDIGVYSYFVLGTSAEGNEVLYKGNFTLLR